MENNDARADEFCAPTENSTDFEIFGNDREAKSVVQRLSNPMMLFASKAMNPLMAVSLKRRAGHIGCPIAGRPAMAATLYAAPPSVRQKISDQRGTGRACAQLAAAQTLDEKNRAAPGAANSARSANGRSQAVRRGS
jgi:hypothetical protein